MSDPNFIDPSVLRYLGMGEGERAAETISKYVASPFVKTDSVPSETEVLEDTSPIDSLAEFSKESLRILIEHGPEAAGMLDPFPDLLAIEDGGLVATTELWRRVEDVNESQDSLE